MNERCVRIHIAPVGLLLAGLAVLPARAADIPEPAPQHQQEVAASPLELARVHVKAQRWAQAVAELQRAPLTSNADWHNLMGFALRKKSPPDLPGAERHYDEALRLKPDHRGALEYSGELYLMKGDLARAEQRLAALQRACPSGCEEWSDLKGDIARFKAAGNKHVAAP
jgi:Flp pilus assembly protein TadD